MAKIEQHTYSIDLDISTPAASKQAFKELQTAFAESNHSMTVLNETYSSLAKHTKDTTELEKQYNKVIAQRLADRDNEIELLEAEKVAIAANKNLSEKQRKERIALKNVEIKCIEVDKKYIQIKQKEVKLASKLGTLIKDDVKGIKDKVKEQFKFIKSLKTTEGRYKSLKKAAGFMLKGGVKAGLGVAGGALAIGGALAGGAIANANTIAEKDKAMKSLKSGVDPSIVDEVYIKTGTDYETIINAINGLSDVTKDSGLLVQGAVLEIQNPGFGKLFLSQNKVDASSISKLGTVFDQIKQQTGAQDLSAAMEASTKSRAVSKSRVDQVEYLQAYSALAGLGFDEEKINKIIDSVSKQSGGFLENLNKVDLSKWATGQQKNQIKNQSLDLKKLDPTKPQETTPAQSMAEKLRMFEMKKNELMVKMLPIVDGLLTKLSDILQGPMLDKIVDGMVGLFTSVMPLMGPVFELLSTMLGLLNPILAVLKPIMDNIIVPALKGLMKLVTALLKYLGVDDEETPAGGKNAQGGIVTAPAIVGEAGPELVIPLDYSRRDRANQIINNFNTNQSFNMSNIQSTPLAFAQAVGNNRYVKRFAT